MMPMNWKYGNSFWLDRYAFYVHCSFRAILILFLDCRYDSVGMTSDVCMTPGIAACLTELVGKGFEKIGYIVPFSDSRWMYSVVEIDTYRIEEKYNLPKISIDLQIFGSV